MNPVSASRRKKQARKNESKKNRLRRRASSFANPWRVAPISAATSCNERSLARYAAHSHRRHSPTINRIASSDTTAARTRTFRFVHFRFFPRLPPFAPLPPLLPFSPPFLPPFFPPTLRRDRGAVFDAFDELAGRSFISSDTWNLAASFKKMHFGIVFLTAIRLSARHST